MKTFRHRRHSHFRGMTVIVRRFFCLFIQQRPSER